MVKKDMNIGFWSHVLQDSKAVARQVLNKIINKPQAPSPTSSDSPTTSEPATRLTTRDTATRSVIMEYESLWEVQLALREIPGMFEENILQPCQPHCSSLPSSVPRPQLQLNTQNMLQEPHQQRCLSTVHPFITTGFEECSQYPFSRSSDDEEEQYMNDDDYLTDIQYHHDASWLSSSPSDSTAKSDHRQDRKDSGVFIHDTEEGVIHHVSSQSVESESKLEERLKDTSVRTRGRALSLREMVMGEDFQDMENRSFQMSLPSLMANVSKISHSDRSIYAA
ncbi:MAG: hypothetical protein J3Q66DRAFT_339341 [Benniella sp.]|nr:MAG: hypothetical protein J3Q66DRAFT_339341 [Benniella sp.]